jgi:hypothetical protein
MSEAKKIGLPTEQQSEKSEDSSHLPTLNDIPGFADLLVKERIAKREERLRLARGLVCDLLALMANYYTESEESSFEIIDHHQNCMEVKIEGVVYEIYVSAKKAGS